jgi:fibronectin-binding autotransporter adhesin
MQTKVLSTIAMAAALLATASSSRAQTDWTGTVSSDWFTAGNWNAGVPTSATSANIDSATPNATVVGAAGATVQNLAVGSVGTGILTIQNGGTVSNVLGAVGNLAGSNGMVTVTGAGSSWTNSGTIVVGGVGKGILTIQNGGTVSSAGGGSVGLNAGSQGTVIVTGAGSAWNNSPGGGLNIGSSGFGTLMIASGGTVNNNTAFTANIGSAAGSQGTVIVTGTGSAWSNSSGLNVGSSGTGTLTIADNGTVTSGGPFIVARGAGAVGTLNIGASAGDPAAAPGTLNAANVAFGAGTGTLNFNHTSNNYIFAPAIGGNGSVNVLAGITILPATNTYTGATTINGGALFVNGSIASSSMTTVSSRAVLGGSGTVGNTIVNGTIAPGNGPIIGTLKVNGNYTQNPGSIYQVKVGSQSDLINITGNAAINGGTVAVQHVAGAAPKTYTIVTATGGVIGTYSDLTHNFAFVTPSLSYDPNNVFLTLQTSFGGGGGGETRNETNVGKVLDAISGSSKDDVAKVITVLANLDSQQGLLALDAISGQPWADFGTMNTNNGMMFMNALGQQMANARGAASAGQRQALAKACEIADCDGTGPLSAWASALGGLGSVLGDGNAATLTYNFAGAATGLDYRIDPRFLVGMGVGYTHGWEWVNSFPGQGYTDSVSVAVYGSYTQSGFYVDALAGYAYYNNQVHRQIMIPGLDQRTATGSTGANQVLGQIEGGYKFDVYAPAAATITPFGRFQITSVTQNGFTESGAQSIDLNVFQQTTNSQRTTIGADLAGAIGIGDDRKLNLDFRLGWMHEFADTSRPLTAAFAGGLGNAFTVFAASPARNSAVLGLSAMANIAATTQVYLRYDGEIATGTDNHAINLGVRFSW